MIVAQNFEGGSSSFLYKLRGFAEKMVSNLIRYVIFLGMVYIFSAPHNCIGSHGNYLEVEEMLSLIEGNNSLCNESLFSEKAGEKAGSFLTIPEVLSSIE